MDYTGSLYEGPMVNGRMEGDKSSSSTTPKYYFPSGTIYHGEFLDGQFHGEGVLVFPECGKYTAVWNKGQVVHGEYSFIDNLKYQEMEWDYCTGSDRRFYKEHVEGLKPAGDTLISNKNPPPEIPSGTWDTGDGYYNPDDGHVYSYEGQQIRLANAEEAEWIQTKCRTG